jgi:phospholipid/cholesterol/gamma-HCH transport system permease protein
LGGYLVAVHLLGMTPGTYFGRMDESIFVDDILLGLVKSLCFGLVVTWICTYKGYYPGRGAKGVARSTTSAVVTSSVLILILDYFITSIML